MAKRLTVEEATQRVIDTVNLLKDAESADIWKYMDKYAALRDLEGEEREEAYKAISSALLGDALEESETIQEAEELQVMEEAPEDIPKELEEVAAPTVKERGKQEECAFSVRPPKVEVPPVGSAPGARRSILDTLLSVWYRVSDEVAVDFEVFVLPLLAFLGAALGVVAGATGKGATRGAFLAHRGFLRALPVARVSLIHLWGAVAVLALLGAKMTILGARMGAKVATKAAGTIREGWSMRAELVNEWRAEAA